MLSGANQCTEVEFSSESPLFPPWESKLPRPMAEFTRWGAGPHTCVDFPPKKNHRVFGDSNPFLRGEALYLISSSFSLFPHHLLQRHTRLPAAISAWLVRFPINSGAVWVREAGRFGIQSALRIVIAKEHISLTPIRISSRSSRRGRFINNNLLALDSRKGSPAIPRATLFTGVNRGGSCVDLHLLGFPKLPGHP